MKNKIKLDKQSILGIIGSVLLFLAHVAIILIIILSNRYFDIYPSLFNYICVIVGCLLIIIDIIYFVGFNHKVLAIKIIVIVLSVFMLIGGSIGTYFIAKANGIVDSVLDNSSISSPKYENFSGAFVYYDKNNSFSSIDELKGKKVGMLYETTNGISYIAKNLLNDSEIKYTLEEYNTNAELIQTLLDGEIDAIVITSAYKEIYSLERDENSPFAAYLDNLISFKEFDEQLKVNTNKKTKNVATEPFNVLLIGYSRTDIGSPVGLADSIIVATINPQTYTVSMMSIARDSFVPISCYGGQYDKINSGRSTSRQCFIQTVEDFIGMDIDYYMELDYLGLVAIVNAIGGIHVNNPVDFELDGVYVPAGDNVYCDGIMALQYCRERHHMPNGDFDRQQHQKEVIIKIAKKFIESKDINLCLQAMDDASEFMSTDLSLKQLTSIFNLLLNTKNYTGIDTFNLVDFQTLRMTGYGGLNYYSYSMRLPLWVYLIYQGSYDESISHMKEVLGNYDRIKQDYNFEFSCRNSYDRPLLYSLEYPNVFMYEPDPMPAFWRTLSGLSLSEAMAWASENGVSLSIEYIKNGDPNYDASLEGLVCDQSVRYGQLVSDFSSGTIYVMGSSEIDDSKYVPNFVDHSYSKAIDWANKYGISIDITYDSNANGKVGDVIEQNPKAFSLTSECSVLKITVKAGTYTIKFDSNGHTTTVPNDITVKTGDKNVTFNNPNPIEVSEAGDKYIFDGWYTDKENGTKVSSTADVTGTDGTNVLIYAHWKKECIHEWDTTVSGADANGWVVTKDATCTEKGSAKRTCKKCQEEETKEIDALGHDLGSLEVDTPATCETEGTGHKHCNRCNENINETISPLGHDYGGWQDNGDGTWTRICSHDPSHIETTDTDPNA